MFFFAYAKSRFFYDAALLYNEEPISYRKMPKYSFDVNDTIEECL